MINILKATANTIILELTGNKGFLASNGSSIHFQRDVEVHKLEVPFSGKYILTPNMYNFKKIVDSSTNSINLAFTYTSGKEWICPWDYTINANR